MCSDSTRCDASCQAARPYCQATHSPAPAGPCSLRGLAASMRYTASGAVLAFIGGVGRLHGRRPAGVRRDVRATIVDATDGVLARAARVKDVLPDGRRRADRRHRRLHHVRRSCRCCCLQTGGLAAGRRARRRRGWSLAGEQHVRLRRAADAKTADHFFTGFPSYWNIVVLYLLLFRVPPAAQCDPAGRAERDDVRAGRATSIRRERPGCGC